MIMATQCTCNDFLQALVQQLRLNTHKHGMLVLCNACKRALYPLLRLQGEECPLDRSCPHSHNAFESWLHPQKYRTLLCKDGDRCNKFVCFFAHGPEQLRLPSNPEPWLAASPAFMPNSCASSLAGTAGGSGSSCQQTQGLVSLMDQVHVARQRAQESRQAALQAEQHLLSVTAALASHAGGMPGQPLHRDPSSLGGVMQSPPMQPTGLQNTGFAPVHKLDAACFATPSPSLVTATSNTMQGLLTVSQPPATGQSLTSTPTSILSTLSSSEPLTLYGSPELQHNPLAGAAPLPGLISSGLLQDFSQSGVPVTTMQSQQQAPVCFVLPQSTQATQQPIVLYQTLGGDVLQSNAGFNTSNNPVYYYG